MYWIPTFNKITYVHDQLQWIDKFIKFLNVSYHSNLWIDIGANKGDISRILHGNCANNDLVWLFEPGPDSYNLLCQQFADNHKIKVYNTALSNYNGTNTFFINKEDSRSGFNFLEKSFFNFDSDEYTKIPCNVQTLDSLQIPEHYQIPFIKIDAEGHDFNILQGASSILKKYRPCVLFEFSGMMGANTFGFTPRQMHDFFKSHNYTIRSMIGGHDEKYIYTHYKINTPEFIDLLAVPIEREID